MSQMSGKSALLLTMLSLGLGFCPLAHADNRPASPARPQTDPQVEKLTADAMQAVRQGHPSLAMILLKNALRLDPGNASLRRQLGIVLFRSGDPAAAEPELRQARLNGAKDPDIVPALLDVMIARKEGVDLLDEFPEPGPNDKSRLAAFILRGRAQAYQAAGDSADAISSMDRSLAILRDANGLLVRAGLAALHSQQNDAKNFIDQALALAPGNPNALLMKADLLRLRDKQAALNIIESVRKAYPNSVDARTARIALMLEMGRIEEAQKDADILYAAAPNLPIAQFYKAVLFGLQNKPQEGWRIAQSLPPEFVRSDARLALGVVQLALASGNIETGDLILRTFVAQHPESAEGRLKLAALRLQTNNAAEALEILKPLMDTKDPAALQLIAATYGKLNQQDNMLIYLRKADAAGSKVAEVKSLLALADLQEGNTAQGVQEVQALLKRRPGNLEPLSAAVGLLIGQKKFAQSQNLTDQAESLNPKNPIPAFLRGQIEAAQDKAAAALDGYNQALQRNPKFIPALTARSQILIAQGEFSAAIRDLKLLQAIEPNDIFATVRLAEIAALQNQPSQSIGLLKQAIARAPTAIAPRLALAKYQVSLHRLGDAETTLKAALRVVPGDPQILALLGSVQQDMGKNAEALTTSKMLSQKYRQSVAAQALLANSLMATGDKKGAIAALKRAVQLSPDVEQYCDALVNLQIQMGDKDGAVASARAWGKGADNATLVTNTLIKVGRLPEAASTVAKAEIADPDWRLALLDSKIASQRGNHARAVSVLKSWLADHSTDLAIRKAYGDLLLRSNDNAGALVQYEAVLNASDDPDVMNNVAWLLRDKDPARALDLATKAAQLQPNSPDIADTLGWILLTRKDAKGALPPLQRAHANGPANGEITYHLALALNSLGRGADAKKLLQEALAQGGNFADIADARKMLQKL
jgi:putative PEP-CTERM system TPR-repeat lipoprotein